MITIEQLLESVDLDFEPRWVTKDESGVVGIWEMEPRKVANGTWCNSGWRTSLAVLKLAEFDGKDWQECIYEVPRKVDMTKWIGHLCCFFNDRTHDWDVYDILTGVDESKIECFKTKTDKYRFCMPVKPDDDVIYKEHEDNKVMVGDIYDCGKVTYDMGDASRPCYVNGEFSVVEIAQEPDKGTDHEGEFYLRPYDKETGKPIRFGWDKFYRNALSGCKKIGRLGETHEIIDGLLKPIKKGE